MVPGVEELKLPTDVLSKTSSPQTLHRESDTVLPMPTGPAKKPWTEEETQKLLMLYKVHGSRWSMIALRFPGRTENDVKNRFYTTLKRVATRAQLEDPLRFTSSFIKCKTNLVQFVDAAIMYGQLLPSKRGRKKNSEKKLAGRQAILFPSPAGPTRLYTMPQIQRTAQMGCPPTAAPTAQSAPFLWPTSSLSASSTLIQAMANMDQDSCGCEKQTKDIVLSRKLV